MSDLDHAERESEARFRVLFEQAAVGVALIDTATGRFLRVNRKYVEIIGYSEQEMLALDFMRLTVPEDLSEDLDRMEQLKRDEIREFSLEKRLLKKDGRPVWVALSVSPTWAVGEHPSRHIAVVVDITERKAAEERSALVRTELESTLAALPDLLFDVDDEGRIYDFRAPQPELLAVPPEAFLGRRFADVLPPEPMIAIDAAIRETLATGRSTGARYRLVLDGVERWFELSMAEKPGVHGRPRMIAIARDITERVVADEHRATLEAQLRQAQKMEAVGTLAGGIAHDFNNLLAAIRLSAELARRGLAEGHPSTAPLEAIDAVVHRAHKLVQQILAFSRMQPVSRVVVSLNDAVVEATNLLRATLPAGIDLALTLPLDAPRVHADPTQLQQVLVNLGTNAWQAIERGIGTIRFEVSAVAIEAGHPTLAPGAYARLGVTDDGVGIDAATLPRIFEPFFTTKGPGRGSGLGLSVVHGIVQEHGGAIDVHSGVGSGTRFDVYLAAVDAEPEPASARALTEVRGEGARVLYVDDEEMILRPALRHLLQLGYRATACASPREALARIVADPQGIDLLITDLNMPELSGIDLAREVFAIRPDLPMVLVSGYAAQIDEDLSEVGIRARLAKPFEVAVLTELLRTLLAPAPTDAADPPALARPPA